MHDELTNAVHELNNWWWVVLLAGAGGLVSFIQKLALGTIKYFSISAMLSSIFVAGFAGIITMLLCEWANLSILLSAALVGIAGHLGGQALFVIEVLVSKKIAHYLGIEVPLIIGPTGPVGMQGVQGEHGVQGIQGVQGEHGVQGIQGEQGEIGPQESHS